MMKGVILAGGLATRLYPLTYATNKHLLPVFNKPMIYYPLETLAEAGITEILVVVSGPHVGHFLSVMRNRHELGIERLEFAYQENPKGGIADALSLAEHFVNGQKCAVILGDNTTDAPIGKEVDSFRRDETAGAHIFLKEVPDPQRFGVPAFHTFTRTSFDEPERKIITEIIEKPENPPSNYAVTGLYLYDNTVFKKIQSVVPSARGELEITSVNNMYLEENRLRYSELDGYWSDAGTFETLFKANEYWRSKNSILTSQ